MKTMISIAIRILRITFALFAIALIAWSVVSCGQPIDTGAIPPGAPGLCPDYADSLAASMGASLPYPDDQGAALPAPAQYEFCWAGDYTYRQGLLCLVCTDESRVHAVTLTDGPCVEDLSRSPRKVFDRTGAMVNTAVCVPFPDYGLLSGADCGPYAAAAGCAPQ